MKKILLLCTLALTSTLGIANSSLNILKETLASYDQNKIHQIFKERSSITLAEKRELEELIREEIIKLEQKYVLSYSHHLLFSGLTAALTSIAAIIAATKGKEPCSPCTSLIGGSIVFGSGSIALSILIDMLTGKTNETYQELNDARITLKLLENTPTA